MGLFNWLAGEGDDDDDKTPGLCISVESTVEIL